MNTDDFKRHLEWAEGRQAKPYQDTVGKWTVGVGRNLTDRGLSTEEIDYLLVNDMEDALLGASTLPYWLLLDPVRQLVVADLVFNLGLAGWRRFVEANQAIALEDYEHAANELVRSRWYQQTGRRARKLVNAMRTGLWVRE